MSRDVAASTTPGRGGALGALAVAADHIEPLSLERIRAAAAAPLPAPPADAVALRLAYAAADPSLLADVHVDAGAVTVLVSALGTGRPLLCDTRMLVQGVASTLRRLGAATVCILDPADASPSAAPLGSVETRRAAQGSTRSARGMVAHAAAVPGAAAVIVGTAPTALLALLDLLGDGVAPPAAVVATCCGLVAAADAKELLLRVRADLGVPVIAVRGPRGGAAVAAAAVNACATAALLGVASAAAR